MSYVSSSAAQKHYKVASQTLRDWANQGKISYIVTDGGHRRYKIEKIDENIVEKKKIVYARVSSKKQEKDLKRQVNALKRLYPDYEVIEDIGSGINHKRLGFKKILEQLFKGNIEEVVVTSGDRFSRFGKDLFEWVFHEFGAKLTTVSARSVKSNQEELADDLMEIITVFGARYYGQRKYNDQKYREKQDIKGRKQGKGSEKKNDNKKGEVLPESKSA